MHRKIITVGILLVSLFYRISFASAHGNEPRLEINLDRLNPGGVLEIRGVDFEFEEVVSLALVGEAVELDLGTLTADAEGVFSYILTLPVDLADGIYIIRARTDDHEIFSPAITVFGPPILLDEAGQGQRDEEDSLLAPMPTFATGIVPVTPMQTSAISEAPTASNTKMPVILIVVILLVIGVMILFLLKPRTL